MAGRQSVLLLFLLAQEFIGNVYVVGTGIGFIRVSDGHFADEECNEFVATGLNT